MQEARGSQQLVRIATAYLASFAFGMTFLVANLTGVDGLTALFRSVVAMVAACVAGRLLIGPAINVVLNAMARDEAARQAAIEAEEEKEAE